MGKIKAGSFLHFIIRHFLYCLPLYATGIISFLAKPFGALFYATLFLYLCNKKPAWFHFLEPYGKLGLTNYSLQGVLGILSMALFIVPAKLSLEYVLAYFIVIYFLQVLFSTIWLKYFKYGPLEWIWRFLTNMKYIPPFSKNA